VKVECLKYGRALRALSGGELDGARKVAAKICFPAVVIARALCTANEACSHEAEEEYYPSTMAALRSLPKERVSWL
jgi:hypothetical protein